MSETRDLERDHARPQIPTEADHVASIRKQIQTLLESLALAQRAGLHVEFAIDFEVMKIKHLTLSKSVL